MAKRLLLVAVLLSAAACFAQCTADPAGGSDCVSPLRLRPATGQSPTLSIDFTPSTAAFPCVPAPAGFYRLCGDGPSKMILVDLGGGYVNLKGVNGVDGKDGADGQSATVAVGAVTSGTPAKVWNSGTASAVVLNFTLPKGDTGAQGPPAIIVGNTLTFGPLTCPKGIGTIPKGFTVPFGCTAKVIAIN